MIDTTSDGKPWWQMKETCGQKKKTVEKGGGNIVVTFDLRKGTLNPFSEGCSTFLLWAEVADHDPNFFTDGL